MHTFTEQAEVCCW